MKPFIDTLLAKKESYKTLTGIDWTLDALDKAQAAHKGAVAASPTKQSAPTKETPAKDASTKASQGGYTAEEQSLLDIKLIGDRIRDMKRKKESVTEEVEKLKSAKANYRQLSGKEWKEDLVAQVLAKTTVGTTAAAAMPEPQPNGTQSGDGAALKAKVDDQALAVRQLKETNADKKSIDLAVAELLSLKKQYTAATGIELTPAKPASKKKDKAPKDNQQKQAKAKPESAAAADADGKKQTKLGLAVSKEGAFSDWYSQMITKAELIEYYDVSGCYVLRPWSFAIWEHIQAFFDSEIKKLGVDNAYFPMFVSQGALEREKDHIADFQPEVAWVTRCGNSEMAEPVAIRPTSETVMYPSYAKWIQSHRDLPLKINQWCNVVRWEFKQPTPFLRTREFLWQEGHSAFATAEEAKAEVYTIVDLYAQVYEDYLAVPVIKGHKTEKEKFAGGEFTTTCEAYIPTNGRAIQGATSHHLGQNFSKMFDISFEHPETREKEFAYQNSWGITTRTIGVFAMIHGDDHGLVLPPKVAKYQVIIIACGVTVNLEKEKEKQLLDRCQSVCKQLQDKGIRAHADLRDNYSPGWKFNHWELKGVPIRIELGPRDLAQDQFVSVRRDTLEKATWPLKELIEVVQAQLEGIHKNLFTKAKKAYDEHVLQTVSWNEFNTGLDKKCLLLAPFCGGQDCEDNIKKDSAKEEQSELGGTSMGAKSLCIPFDQPKETLDKQKCVHPACALPAKHWCLFGRSY